MLQHVVTVRHLTMTLCGTLSVLPPPQAYTTIHQHTDHSLFNARASNWLVNYQTEILNCGVVGVMLLS
jgi:hypothetical protein